ncbi:MAG: ATP-dependent helicase [Sedimentisphaerales bacterium]|jgi:DNA helicase-2/ATP-dependent DNA helicase PcrA
MLITDYETIVNSRDAPMVVLAGPGSGKTYLLGDRIKWLLDNGVSKDNITVLTYTTDANHEMKARLTSSSEPWKINYSDLPHVSTMHSIGLKIIQEKPHQLKLNKTDLKVQEDEIIKRLVFRDASLILGYDEEIAIKSYRCKQYGNCQAKEKKPDCQICEKYWEIMSKCNRVDFDDQILLACKILENNPDVLEKYQNQSQHLLVDEYQDINTAQFRLIELLSRQSRSGLFVVGDDAQSIYAFRGANPDFILNFTGHFPGAKKATLCTARRCPKKIMDAAFTILEKNYANWTGRPKLEYLRGEGEGPLVYKVGNEHAEAKKVAKIVASGIEEKKDILVLSPRKDVFPFMIDELSKRGIHCDCGISFLPERIKRATIYMQWAMAPDDNFLTRLAIENLLNTGINKIPGENKKKLKNAESIKRRVEVEREIAHLWQNVDRKHSLFEQIRQSPQVEGIVNELRSTLVNLCEAYDKHKEFPGEFAKQLAVSSGMWTNPEKLSEDLSEVTRLLTPAGIPIVGCVRLRTMRKAKGLGAQIVIIVGLEDDMVPGTDGDVAEQARLFYVSMTRAEEKLYLIHSIRRERGTSFGQDYEDKPRSRFLDSLKIESQWAPYP